MLLFSSDLSSIHIFANGKLAVAKKGSFRFGFFDVIESKEAFYLLLLRKPLPQHI
jgi:hypothetical protein